MFAAQINAQESIEEIRGSFEELKADLDGPLEALAEKYEERLNAMKAQIQSNGNLVLVLT